MIALKGLSMDKWLCWASLGVAGATFVFFLLIFLAKGFPPGVGTVIDIFGMVCCALLAYLAWDTLRDIR